MGTVKMIKSKNVSLSHFTLFQERNTMTENKLLGSIEDHVREAESGRHFDGSEKIRIGMKRHETTVMPLKRADKVLVLGYPPQMAIAYVIGDLAEKTNWAMDPDTSRRALKQMGLRRIHQSKHWPIKVGDLVKIALVGYRSAGTHEKAKYTSLLDTYERIHLPLYEIMQEEGRSGLIARPYFAHEALKVHETKSIPKCLEEVIPSNEIMAKVYVQIRLHVNTAQMEKVPEEERYHAINLSTVEGNHTMHDEIASFFNVEEFKDLPPLEQKKEYDLPPEVIEKQRRISKRYRFENDV